MKHTSKSYAIGPYTVRQDHGTVRLWRVFVGASHGSVAIFAARTLDEASAFARQMCATGRTQPTLVPANGGTEQPFTTKLGRRVQYMYDVERNTHVYLDLDTDTVLPRDFSPDNDGGW